MANVCPQCKTLLTSEETVCPICSRGVEGTSSRVKSCPMCGENVPSDAATCQFCAEPLQGGRGFNTAASGLWRDGNTLVIKQHATLPDRCVKSNQPTQGRLKRSLSWHSPAIFALLFVCGPLPYIIIAVIVRKNATIHIGLSEDWFAKRRRATLIGWLSVLIGMGMFALGITMVGKKNDIEIPLMLFGFLFSLIGAIVGLMLSRLVSPKKITDTHIWLNGVCSEYLEGLPEWRG